MGNGTRKPHRRAVHIPWATLSVIAGTLVAGMALASLALRPEGVGRLALWLALGVGASAGLGGAAALLWHRWRAQRGLMADAGPAQRLGPVALILLALALLAAVLPLPYPSPWLSLAPPVVLLGGAVALALRLLADGTTLGYYRALRAYREGDTQRALALVRQVGEASTEGAARGVYGLRHLEAILLRESGDLAAARAVADRLVAWRPDLYYGHAEQGLILLAAGEARAAGVALERAVACAPQLAEGHYNLGMARAEAGDAAGAVCALERALRLGLRDEVTRLIARYHLARAYAALGMAREAAAETRWLRRQWRVVRRWREALAAERVPPGGHRRTEELITAIAGVVREGRDPGA